jgi:hypothetical protein
MSVETTRATIATLTKALKPKPVSDENNGTNGNGH